MLDFQIVELAGAWYALPRSKRAKEICKDLRCKSLWNADLDMLKKDLKDFELKVH